MADPSKYGLSQRDFSNVARYLGLDEDKLEEMMDAADPQLKVMLDQAQASLAPIANLQKSATNSFGAGSTMSFDADGNICITPGQGGAFGSFSSSVPSDPTPPEVLELLKAGTRVEDGSLLVTRENAEAVVQSLGLDPSVAENLLLTLVSNGAQWQAGGILIPPAMLQELAPDFGTVVGKRLPDGTAALTIDDVAKILEWDQNDTLTPEEWMRDMTLYGCVLHDDVLIVPPDLVDALALPVPPIPQSVARTQQKDPPSVAEVLGLSEEIVQKRHKQVIQHDAYDREMFDDLVAVSPLLQQNVEAGADLLKTWDELAFDLWNLIYKVQPKVRDEVEIEPAYLANLHLILYALQTEGFAELREVTAGSITDSILGYEVLVLDVLEYIRKCLEEYEKQQQQQGEGRQPGDGPASPGQIIAQANQMVGAQQQLQGAQAAQQALQDMIGQLQQNGQPIPAQLAEAAKDAQAQQQQAEQTLNQLQEQMKQTAQDLKQQLQQALNGIGEKTLNDIGDVRKWVAQWGLGGSDRPNVRMNPGQTRAAIERIRHNRDFQKFADLLGRFRQIALADVKKKSKKNGIAIKDVKVSNEIQNALAGEYSLLGDKVLETEFYRKYAEGQLLTYVKENTDAKGKGPGIICFDMSGSMSGDRINWAEAVTLSLVEVFQKQKRDVIVIAFDDAVRKVWVFEHDKLDANDLLDIASISASGGTNFEEPLEVALQAITGKYEHPKLKAAIKKANLTSHKFKKADITFITDGDCGFSGVGYMGYVEDLTQEDIRKYIQQSEFLKRYHEIKDDKEFVCRTVLINYGSYGASDATARLFSDKIVKLNDISDLGEVKAAEIFADARGLSGADDLIDVSDSDDEDND